MTKVRARGEAVRRHIVENLERHPTDIAKITADRFGITRQAVNKHLQRLVSEGALTQHGKTRSRSYRLAPLLRWEKTYPLSTTLAEDQIWREGVAPSLGQMPQNVLDIWHYGFTEIFNNALDH